MKGAQFFNLNHSKKNSVMEGPVTTIWGPALWNLFHHLAELTGNKTIDTKEADEKRLWRSYLYSLRACIPCARCKKHYIEYLNGHSLEPVFRLKRDQWGKALRTWLWTFHNHVRTESKQDLIFPEETLTSVYGPVPKAQVATWKMIIAEHMRRAMFMRLHTRDDVLRYVRCLEELYICLTVL
jgi:hypothetical protein